MAQRILVVDDDPNVVQLIRLNLQANGYEVAVAYDGRAALRDIEAYPPDLVILDIMMPGMSGREVLDRLKANARTESIPVLMLTALSDPAAISESLSQGAEWHLTKPFELEELTSMVRRLLTAAEP